MITLAPAGLAEAFLLTLARVAPLAIVVPFVALDRFPALVRIAVAVGLAAVLTPIAHAAAPDALPATVVEWIAALVREIALGGVFAVAAALPFWALRWAGRLSDSFRGALGAESLGVGAGGDSPLATLYLLLGVAAFAALGGHRVALGAFAETLVEVPIGSLVAPSVDGLAEVVLRLVGEALAFAAVLAAPVALTAIVVELAFAFGQRVVSGLAGFFAALPARAALGLGAALLSLSFLVESLPGAFRGAVEMSGDLVRLLGS